MTRQTDVRYHRRKKPSGGTGPVKRHKRTLKDKKSKENHIYRIHRDMILNAQPTSSGWGSISLEEREQMARPCEICEAHPCRCGELLQIASDIDAGGGATIDLYFDQDNDEVIEVKHLAQGDPIITRDSADDFEPSEYGLPDDVLPEEGGGRVPFFSPEEVDEMKRNVTKDGVLKSMYEREQNRIKLQEERLRRLQAGREHRLHYDKEWNEWQVRVFDDGVFNKEATYHAADKEDAVLTKKVMERDDEHAVRW